MKQTKSTKLDKIVHNNGQLKKEIALLIPFIKQPWKNFTLTEIKELTKNKSHHYVFEALDKFAQKTTIKKEMRGNTNIYKLNEITQILDYFIMAELSIKEKSAHLPVKVIQQIQEKIKEVYYTLIITGSYTQNKQKSNSDLDIAIIIPNEKNKKPFEIALKEGELTLPEVHGFVFTEEEFYQMLINNEFNFGKECAKSHILIYGLESYYKILLRGLQNGFKG